MPAHRRASRTADSDHQLTLPLARLSEEEFLRALHARGAVFVRAVRFRPNRTRLVSLSADRRQLNLHECFRSAPARLLDAVTAFTTAPARSHAFRRAIEQMREWHEGQVAEHGSARPRASCGTRRQLDYLGSVYRCLNRTHFGGRLPDTLVIRLSDRMSRRFGHVSYARTGVGERRVAEMALNIDLLLPGNERALVDTILHEMAHIEAWILYGHRAHGRAWREVARRIGCEPRACTHTRLKRRRSAEPVTAVPSLQLPRPPEPGDAAQRIARSGVRRAARRRA